MSEPRYTTQLQAGLGMIDETEALLDLWQPDMSIQQLYQGVLEACQFPNVSARRLRNIVAECFAPRYLTHDGEPARQLKALRQILSAGELHQLFFIYTCRANAILGDFVREVYWPAYGSGRPVLAKDDAKDFVIQSVQSGLTTTNWSETTVNRVAGYLTGACADFGLLETAKKPTRKVIRFKLESRVAAWLAYDLRFKGLGDNNVVSHRDWGLFGLERWDVVEELKRLALTQLFIVQTAGEVVRISWECKTPEEVADGLSQG